MTPIFDRISSFWERPEALITSLFLSKLFSALVV